MYPSVAAAFPSSVVQEEGWVHHPYLDNEGLVTFGMGILGDGAAKARFMSQPWTVNGRGVDLATVEHWWGVVKAAQDHKMIGGGQPFWDQLTPLRLDDDAIAKATVDWLRDNEPGLVEDFPGYPTMRADAQLALLGMEYAMGSRFGKGYPKLRAYLNAVVPNYAGAADECAINKNVTPAIAAHNATNRQLFLNAAAAMHTNSPQDQLWWPANVNPGDTPTYVASLAANKAGSLAQSWMFQSRRFLSVPRLLLAALGAGVGVLGISMVQSARRGEGWAAPVRRLGQGAERFGHAVDDGVARVFGTPKTRG